MKDKVPVSCITVPIVPKKERQWFRECKTTTNRRQRTDLNTCSIHYHKLRRNRTRQTSESRTGVLIKTGKGFVLSSRVMYSRIPGSTFYYNRNYFLLCTTSIDETVEEVSLSFLPEHLFIILASPNVSGIPAVKTYVKRAAEGILLRAYCRWSLQNPREFCKGLQNKLWQN